MRNVKGQTIKKVLVTGGAGFIGSHLCERLSLFSDVEIVSLDNHSAGDRDNLLGIRCSDVNGDILDEQLVDDVMDGVDVVFHNAASKKNICLDNPKRDLDVNGKGTLMLLMAAKKHGVKKFIYASTGSVYGQPVRFPIDEDHPLNPMSYYGVSKLAGERYVQMFHKIHGLNTTVLRYFHVYGPRQSSGQHGAVIPTFINGALVGCKVDIHGSGSQERSFTFVDDVVDANILSVFYCNRSNGMIYNCASGVRITVLSMYRM
jgi:nucleoside-diphosphate-sugar epimerase